MSGAAGEMLLSVEFFPCELKEQSLILSSVVKSPMWQHWPVIIALGKLKSQPNRINEVHIQLGADRLKKTLAAYFRHVHTHTHIDGTLNK